MEFLQLILIYRIYTSQVWWYICVILFKRLKQEDHKFQASVGYIAGLHLKQETVYCVIGFFEC